MFYILQMKILVLLFAEVACCYFLLTLLAVCIVWVLHVQVRGGQLWGTDVYTYDSDLVASMWCYG